jgi:hypothetical protein
MLVAPGSRAVEFGQNQIAKRLEDKKIGAGDWE